MRCPPIPINRDSVAGGSMMKTVAALPERRSAREVAEEKQEGFDPGCESVHRDQPPPEDHQVDHHGSDNGVDVGIGGGSRGWLRTGHGRERYHGPMNHDTVTVRCDRMGIELSRVPRRDAVPAVSKVFSPNSR